MTEDAQAAIDRLERELAELKATVLADTAGTGMVEGSSRRGMLRAVAAGVAGAAAAGVAGLVGAQPAAANDPNDLTLGGQKFAAGLTEGVYTGTAPGAAFLFQSGNVYDPSDASYPCALAGWGNTTAAPHGVYAFSSVPGAFAAVAVSAGTGLLAVGAEQGAHLLLLPYGPAGPARTGTHNAGEVVVDENNELWLCVADGSPGEWRKLAGASAAGVFHAVSPRRVYDSREGASKLAASAERTISVGFAAGVEVVPPGATAVAVTFTVTNTEGVGGFVSVRPAVTAWAGTSSINWFGPDQNIATTVISALGGDRELTVRGGAASTDIVVDVTGYYR